MKFSLDLKVNDKCNMNCNYCQSHDNGSSRISSLEDIVNLSRYLQNIILDNKINIVILGGEVTILKSGTLTDYINTIYSSFKNVGKIHIYTNCKIFSNELFDLSNKYDNLFINVSVDTVDENINQRDISIENLISNISKYNVNRVIINSTLDNITMSKYADLVVMFKRIGVTRFKFKFERLNGNVLEDLGCCDDICEYFKHNIIDTSGVKFINNFSLNTIYVDNISIGGLDALFEVHSEHHNNRIRRTVFKNMILDRDIQEDMYD